jgi:homoserine kinase
VIAPGSSANLGPGFDALGLAVDLPFTFAVGEGGAAEELLVCDDTHPAAVAYRAAGGRSDDLRWRSPIPPGRGLGFSGAARVAGALAGRIEVAGALAGRSEGSDASEASGAAPDDRAVRAEALAIASDLERHPDNAAASMLGGFVVAAGGRAIRVPLALELELVVWWPAAETSTERARSLLPGLVPFADAVFNVGRASLLVAALATGDLAALRTATEDRLHTEVRVGAAPASRPALDAFDRAGAAAVWLSGSGPTVAALVEAGAGEELTTAAPPDGVVRVLRIDQRGARIEIPTN